MKQTIKRRKMVYCFAKMNIESYWGTDGADIFPKKFYRLRCVKCGYLHYDFDGDNRHIIGYVDE